MNILIASGGLKDVFTPSETCNLIKNILLDVFQEKNITINEVPMADGGEYSTDVLAQYFNKSKTTINHIVSPTGEEVSVDYLELDNGYVYIGSSEVLALSNNISVLDKNPMLLTSFGLGQLINNSINKGYKKIIMGLGGTSTVDAGIGMAQALGTKFYDNKKREIQPKMGKYLCGADLLRIKYINTTFSEKRLRGVKIHVLCDTEISVSEMDVPTSLKIGRGYKDKKKVILKYYVKAFQNYCSIIDKLANNNMSFVSSSYYNKYYGVAGGILMSLINIVNIKPSLGFRYFADQFDIESKIINSDYVITAEGRFDITLRGKTPAGIAELALKNKKKVLLVCGKITPSLKKYIPGYISNSLPEYVLSSGISQILTCDPFYKNIDMPTDYSKEVEIYKNNTYNVLLNAFKMIINERFFRT